MKTFTTPESVDLTNGGSLRYRQGQWELLEPDDKYSPEWGNTFLEHALAQIARNVDVEAIGWGVLDCCVWIFDEPIALDIDNNPKAQYLKAIKEATATLNSYLETIAKQVGGRLPRSFVYTAITMAGEELWPEDDYEAKCLIKAISGDWARDEFDNPIQRDIDDALDELESYIVYGDDDDED
jgi:hypothetical protein